ncbi:tetratricopeptide repeat protein [Geothrix sp. PMB-07]|uniref:tetratricopeptide repeat protein n=1 Tax=Geothrix sp. PMB-07 TaxID=3068640 RepID=UPI002740365B|nr:SEL1-like repeat protein [Geothrix sp. PMB-07]WLT32892.1 SEL1-like repeat protein [Geothrix sp. PMB-07]
MPESEPHDPTQPGLSPDATVRLPIGVPEDPRATVPLKVGDYLSLDSTQRLPVGVPKPPADQTQKIALSRPDEPPLRTQRVAVPAEAEGQTQPGPVAPLVRKPLGWRLPAALVGLAALAVASYAVLTQRPTPQASRAEWAVTPPEKVPPEVQVYIDQAKAGDTHAMRMLGTLYLQGLNVPKDREKGLYWYRKAAEKGSDAARTELRQIEGGN